MVSSDALNAQCKSIHSTCRHFALTLTVLWWGGDWGGGIVSYKHCLFVLFYFEKCYVLGTYCKNTLIDVKVISSLYS